MNQFGGTWTEAKMQIVVDYAKAYLTIMNKQHWAKTLYFDGFAGSGSIELEAESEIAKGTALRILDLNEPNTFDIYYFVEMNEVHKKELENTIKKNYADKKGKCHVVQANCNAKLKDMANFLKKNKNYRVLAFIDPYGMSVNWDSIVSLEGLGIDLWILVPSGIGVSRLLKTNGEISEAWLNKLEQFLGVSKEELYNQFYKTQTINTLFGKDTLVEKEKKSIEKIGALYSGKLKEVFQFVSDSFIMRNRKNAIMYHFMMATNNANALKIANDVIKPKYKL